MSTILLNGTLVRMTPAPATTCLPGNWAWHFPAWSARMLPDVDLDGRRRMVSDPQPTAGILAGAEHETVRLR